MKASELNHKPHHDSKMVNKREDLKINYKMIDERFELVSNSFMNPLLKYTLLSLVHTMYSQALANITSV